MLSEKTIIYEVDKTFLINASLNIIYKSLYLLYFNLKKDLYFL